VGGSRRVIVEADGGSRGNPGPAGWGALVRDAATGTVLVERWAGIGPATNNVAEYSGLIAGLTAALALGEPVDVEVRMDSKLVVEQMSGRWKVKHPDMVPLAGEAMALVRQLAQVSFTWIPREANRDADRLANRAMDEQQSTATPTAPLKGFDSTLLTRTAMVWARHGQTEHSARKLFSGSSDPVLTELGERQAEALVLRLQREPIDLILASPLRRAQQTAAAAAAVLGLEVGTDERLRETDFGTWEGFSYAEIAQRDPEALRAWQASPTVAPPGGESFAATEVRVRSLWADVLARHEGLTVLLVSHVSPIKTAIRIALEAPPATLHRLHLDLCSVSICDVYGDGHSVLRVANDHAHLPV
jgi:broad specificity phosphatase PhoE/ribonuclease HI